MNKTVILLLVALLVCVSSIHMQKFAPSTPGGQYQPQPSQPRPQNTPNGTQPSYPNYNYNQPRPQPQQSTILVNGRPYQFTGPFDLVCFNSNGSVYRKDSCFNANQCAALINDYRNCRGTVKKYNRQ